MKGSVHSGLNLNRSVTTCGDIARFQRACPKWCLFVSIRGCEPKLTKTDRF